MTVSTDPTIGASDLVIQYTYQTKTFPANRNNLPSACVRAVTQKQVRKDDGTFNTWNYIYPPVTQLIHTVTVNDPNSNSHDVTFQGYNTGSDHSVWKIGKILTDETFNGINLRVAQKSFPIRPHLTSSNFQILSILKRISRIL